MFQTASSAISLATNLISLQVKQKNLSKINNL